MSGVLKGTTQHSTSAPMRKERHSLISRLVHLWELTRHLRRILQMHGQQPWATMRVSSMPTQPPHSALTLMTTGYWTMLRPLVCLVLRRAQLARP